MEIRTATQQDWESINRVYYSAFPKDECELVAKLAVDLLAENTTPQTISLIAEVDNALVGHVAFSPAGIEGFDRGQAYILAPLAVDIDHQKNGIGSSLVNQGIKRLSAVGVNILFVYGDPNYYAKFGFEIDIARSFATPYKLEYPSGWQAMVLNSCSIPEEPVAISCVASLCDSRYW